VEWSKDARDESGEWDFQQVRDTTTMLKIVGREAILLAPVDTPDEEP
jgi:hypothetical protein